MTMGIISEYINWEYLPEVIRIPVGDRSDGGDLISGMSMTNI